MNSYYSDNIGKLFLRLSLGFLLILHGYGKINLGIENIENILIKNDLPQILANGVYIGEIIAPIFVILGYFTRTFSFIILINMIVAIYLVHPNELISMKTNGGLILELQYFYIISSILIIIFGAGKYSLDK